MSDVDSVRVALRIRPLIKSEVERGCQEVVQHTVGISQVIVNRTDAFTFNHVFDPRNTQADVYQDSVAVLLDRVFGGFNATILAYGQTGSGKTHTMGTAFTGELNDDVGVIPRVLYELFKRIEELADSSEFVVSCSFMELYQEQLYDLLSTKSREEAVVDLREDRNGIIIPGLTEQVVSTAKETTDCLVRGSSGRAVASTAMNQQSSRSHAIFTVTLQATKKGDMKTVTTSKFHLVDLAGSERSKKTMATGDRFKEGVKINQGLLALGNVISALGSGQGSGFVRYRDSKLTRLLQDSLGGNSVTLMIACVSPADYNVPETLSTLRYADRARKIKNKPIVNQDPHAAEINHLKEIIQKLRLELLAAGGGNNLNMSAFLRSKSAGEISLVPHEGQQLHLEHQQLKEKYHNMQKQLQTTLHDVVEHEMRAHIAEAAHEKLRTQTDEIKRIVGELKQDFTVDATKTQLVANVARVKEIHVLINGLDEELERTESELCDHKRLTYTLIEDGGNDNEDEATEVTAKSLEVHALMQKQNDDYTSKQMNFKDQLSRLNRELNLKEELQQRVAGNLNKFCTLDTNIDAKYEDCEAKIKELETEKSELLDKLRHVKENASAKLAEERRRRLQALEQEIGDMKRKNMQQAKLLKVREKETQKIKNLSSEIQVMKESKVKLIRAMRHESEVFRQWKLTREKELMQLRNKDRKLQNEMARKDMLHTKQRNVLKRKCEEAMSINKRLKDALERQKVAQTLRQKQQSAKDVNAATNKIEQLLAAVERELEVIVSLVDAEQSLEQLMEDRCIITRQIATQQAKSPAGEELTNLEEELEMRNAQIADLQQKVCAEDLDARMRSLWETIHSEAEGRAVAKQLLKSVIEMRREYANRSLEQRATLEEQRTLREAADMQCASAAKRMRLLEIEHENAIAERENTCEEKIAVLLRELHHAPQLAGGATPTPEQAERLRIQEEQFNKMDQMREELEHYRQLVSELEDAVQKTDQRQRMMGKRFKVDEPAYVEVTDSEEIEEGDDERDPDWHKTPRPLHRKRSTATLPRRTFVAPQSLSDDTSGMEETFVTASSGRRRSNGCGCRGICNTKRCGCFSKMEKCSATCRCSIKCSNGKQVSLDSSGDVKKEHSIDEEPENEIDEEESKILTTDIHCSSEERPVLKEHKFIKPEDSHSFLTPKLARLSHISFDTPSSKKKFFN